MESLCVLHDKFDCKSQDQSIPVLYCHGSRRNISSIQRAGARPWSGL
jgi:hypothetical protein